MPNMTTNTSIPPLNSPRLRLEFLDGIRGLAALYVVVGHACAMVIVVLDNHYSMVTDESRLPRFMIDLISPVGYIHYSVVVFIVVSGYCLMLPVVRSMDGALKGGTKEYLKRRARRILPPYYAALILSLLMIALVPGMNNKSHSCWSLSLPAFTPDILISHLLLLHNLKSNWIGKINGPLWSVATEWQIYFLLPFLLLPIWRRFGTAAVVVWATILGLGLHHIFFSYLEQAAPWFIGAFALGMAGASLNFSLKPQEIALREHIHWGVLSAGSVALLIMLIRHFQSAVSITWLLDTVAAFGAMCLLVWCTRHAVSGVSTHPPILLRLFSSRMAVTLGTFSYSLYLVHFPVLGALDLAFRALHFSPPERLTAQLGIAVPITILLSYVFYLTFEKRFLPGNPQTEQQAIAATMHEPAI